MWLRYWLLINLTLAISFGRKIHQMNSVRFDFGANSFGLCNIEQKIGFCVARCVSVWPTFGCCCQRKSTKLLNEIIIQPLWLCEQTCAALNTFTLSLGWHWIGRQWASHAPVTNIPINSYNDSVSSIVIFCSLSFYTNLHTGTMLVWMPNWIQSHCEMQSAWWQV